MSDMQFEKLFANNKAWSERMRAENPEFFSNLAQQRRPPGFAGEAVEV